MTTDALVTRGLVFSEVNAERDRQDARWGGIPGEERRDDHTYAAVIGEEFGEACKAWLERDTAALREELVQLAACAVAWIEELDNGGAVARSWPVPAIHCREREYVGLPSLASRDVDVWLCSWCGARVKVVA